MTVVLDSSALLAVSFAEPGAESVAAVLGEALVSSVSVAEVVAKYIDKGLPPDESVAMFRAFGLEVAALDAGQAELAGRLRGASRERGLSLGDRCCLALALNRAARVMTADRAWAGLDLGIDIEVIR